MAQSVILCFVCLIIHYEFILINPALPPGRQNKTASETNKKKISTYCLWLSTLVISNENSIYFTLVLFHLTDKIAWIFFWLYLHNWGIDRETEKILCSMQSFRCPSDVVIAMYFSPNGQNNLAYICPEKILSPRLQEVEVLIDRKRCFLNVIEV